MTAAMETMPGRGWENPGALPLSCGLATQPGGHRGPVWESGGLASAPEGQNIPPCFQSLPEANPGHLTPMTAPDEK